MDIESDESERWEDFFGSSTDLAPSLIGYYDRLSGANGVGNHTASENVKNTEAISSADDKKLLKEIESTVFSTKNSISIRVLSPSVQRMLAHTADTNYLPAPTRDSLKATSRTGNKKALANATATTTTTTTTARQTHFHIALSKNTCKLSQSGSELVETVNLFSSKSMDDQKPEGATISLSCDEDKTPTNSYSYSYPQTFTYDKHKDAPAAINAELPVENSHDEYLHEPLTSADALLKATNRVKSIIKKLQSGVKKSTSILSSDSSDDENDAKHLTEIQNTELIKSMELKQIGMPADKLNLSPIAGGDNIETAANPSPKPTHRLSYSRAKILGSRSVVPAISSETIQTEDLNSHPSNGGKNEVSGSYSGSSETLATLNHRPLSELSICSTSSSSSSGSDHLLATSGRLGISYLASVESLADHSEGESLNGGLTMCERAAREIIDSEKSYVEDLGQVIRGYFEDWKERACLTLDGLNILFSNIQEIYNFNVMLLKRLVNSGTDPIRIAKCFIEMKESFDVYTIYCTSYPEAISLLTSLLQASHTNALLTSTQKILRHNLPLGSYLLKPVQRILKYHLLLDNLRKHCEVAEVAYAHDLMRAVARNIDQVKRSLEQQSRVKELSGILDGWLGPELTVLGELRQEGLLMENNKPRVVFLFKTMLILTKPKEDSRLQFKTYIHCKNLMLVEHLPGEPTSFHVIPFSDPRNQIKLTARNRDQKRLWAQHIKQVMLEHFDIPNRAKELVFKLGDEEDRTPDKNTWKWGTTHSSTPEYLERRNQYRRSEMRYRSKKARKNITTSVSLDNFSGKDTIRSSNSNNSSLDDSNSRVTGSKEELTPTESSLSKCIEHRVADQCTCAKVKSQLSDTLSRSVKAKERGRSKSEPRIPENFTPTMLGKNLNSGEESGAGAGVGANDNGSNVSFSSLTLGRCKMSKMIEVKMYNTKTLPKRIANLKKSRAKTIGSTSKFYMDLDPDNSAVLRITESRDNLVTMKEDDEKIGALKMTINAAANKNDMKTYQGNADEFDVKDIKDVDIISELLKEKKDFERILKKPPKKKSLDNSRDSLLPLLFEQLSPSPLLPHKITTAIVGDYNDINDKNSAKDTPAEMDSLAQLVVLQANIHTPEPIYESLLRNVHVPYKYSPVLKRALSHQTTGSPKIVPKPVRPESDYVTLVYTEEVLQSVNGANVVKTEMPSELLQLRSSDSNINYNKMANGCERIEEPLENSSSSHDMTSDELTNSELDKCERRDSGNIKTTKNMLQRFISARTDDPSGAPRGEPLKTRVRKSVDNLSVKFTERHVSDVTEMCRQSAIYKQGSENLGSRIAHLDYVDPRTLFPLGVNTNILINKAAMKQQRDSVFSLTSSSDSVCDGRMKEPFPRLPRSRNGDIENSFYEDKVEECLENDFRDSAVYSDDPDRRHESKEDMHSVTPDSPPPPTFPRQVTKKRLQSPPPIPAKPAFIQAVASKKDNRTENNTTSPLSQTNSKGWVFQQIKNFSSQ